MDSRRLAYLKALDIDVWERRDGSAHATVPQPELDPPAVKAPSPRPAVDLRPRMEAAPLVADTTGDSEVSAMGWEELATAVRSCTKCPLHATRTNGVFGVGDRTSR